jgi:hypothetical protein
MGRWGGLSITVGVIRGELRRNENAYQKICGDGWELSYLFEFCFVPYVCLCTWSLIALYANLSTVRLVVSKCSALERSQALPSSSVFIFLLTLP